MRSADLEVQDAIKAKVNAELPTITLVTHRRQAEGDRYTIIGNSTETFAGDKTEDRNDITHTLVSWATTTAEAKTDRAALMELLTTRIRSNYITLGDPFYVITQQVANTFAGQLLKFADEQTKVILFGAPLRVRFLIGQTSTT